MDGGASKPIHPLRINVVGVSGSGKSTVTRQLSAITRIPAIEMDALYWKPGWVDSTDGEFFPKLEQALEAEEWILDGNYSRTQPIKWRRSTIVMWLDYSFPRTLWQAVRRACKRSFTKEELWPGTGNRESFRKSFFNKDSIIWWSITSRARQRSRYFAAMEDPAYAHLDFIRLTSPRQARIYCRELELRLNPLP